MPLQIDPVMQRENDEWWKEHPDGDLRAVALLRFRMLIISRRNHPTLYAATRQATIDRLCEMARGRAIPDATAAATIAAAELCAGQLP